MNHICRVKGTRVGRPLAHVAQRDGSEGGVQVALLGTGPWLCSLTLGGGCPQPTPVLILPSVSTTGDEPLPDRGSWLPLHGGSTRPSPRSSERQAALPSGRTAATWPQRKCVPALPSLFIYAELSS